MTDGGHNLDDGTSCSFSSANGSLSNTDPHGSIRRECRTTVG